MNGTRDLNEVREQEFHLLENDILEKHSDIVYWFKIPFYDTEAEYMVRFEYYRINDVQVYQGVQELKRLPNERYASYTFSRDEDVYIKVTPKLNAYIPVHLDTQVNSVLRDRIHMFINGFYYGFVCLIMLYSFSYYFVFKDKAFFHYTFFLFSVSFGMFLLDGMFNFFGLGEQVNDFFMTLNYLFLAFFTGKFANYYLLLDNYYPKHKKWSYALGSLAVLLGLLYLIYQEYYLLLLVNALVFVVIATYWVYGLLLFRKNIYIKIFVFAEVLVLLFALDLFILRFLGVPTLEINAIHVKIGCFLEMLLLSVAVLYRMSILKGENKYMKNEIIKYSNELTIQNKLEQLSSREREIFSLIASIKTNKEIAEELNVSVNTVKFHIKNIYEKLEISSRKEALSIAKNAVK